MSETLAAHPLHFPLFYPGAKVMVKVLMLIIYTGFYSAGATSEIVSDQECKTVKRNMEAGDNIAAVYCISMEPTP